MLFINPIHFIIYVAFVSSLFLAWYSHIFKCRVTFLDRWLYYIRYGIQRQKNTIVKILPNCLQPGGFVHLFADQFAFSDVASVLGILIGSTLQINIRLVSI